MPKMTGAKYEKKVEEYLQNHQDHLAIHRLRSNQPLTEAGLKGLERALTEIGEEDDKVLLNGFLQKTGAPSLAWFVRSMVGMGRTAAQAAFSQFLGDRSLTSAQIRFIEMVIDQLTARWVMEASAVYGPPFSNLDAGGPDALFEGTENVLNGVFEALQAVRSQLVAKAG